jgi:hypothetical protein
MTPITGQPRVPIMQMSPAERRDYLARLDPASRKQTEERLGITLEGTSSGG